MSINSSAPYGRDIATPTPMPAGGSGVRGWLSAIWTKLNGTVSVSIDSAQRDDDGNLYVNPNVPGADIATGDKQSQQLAALLQLLSTPGVLGAIQSIAAPVAVSSVGQIPLAANAAVESVGNLQKVADTLEAVLLELRVHSALLTQLQQPMSDGPEQLREDLNLSLQ